MACLPATIVCVNSCAPARGGRGAQSRRDTANSVASTVPVWMLSGELDPVTPPSRAEKLLKHLPNGTHRTVRNNGHPFSKLEGCRNGIIAKFIDAASMKGIETGCVGALPPVPFVYF